MQSHCEAPPKVVTFHDASSKTAAAAKFGKKESPRSSNGRRKIISLWNPILKKHRLQKPTTYQPDDNGNATQSQDVPIASKVKNWRCHFCASAKSKDDLNDARNKSQLSQKSGTLSSSIVEGFPKGLDESHCTSNGNLVRQHTKHSDWDPTDDEFPAPSPELGSLQGGSRSGKDLFTWMFVFKVPSQIPKRDSYWFSFLLRFWWKQSGVNIVNCGFKFAENEAVQQSFDAPLPFRKSTLDRSAQLLQPLMSCVDDYIPIPKKTTSYRRAQQCTIELFHGFLEFLNASMQEAFAMHYTLTNSEAQRCRCGNIYAPDAVYCRKCGEKRSKREAKRTKRCNCGNFDTVDARYCQTCGGTRFEEPEMESHCEPPSNVVKHHCFASRDKSKIYFCIRCEKEIVESFADAKEYPLQLDEAQLRKKFKIKDLPQGTQGSTQADCSCGKWLCQLCANEDTHSPAYVKYDTSNRHNFRKYRDLYRPEENTVLLEIDRIRLVFDRITDDVNLHLLATFGLIEDRFPLHHPTELDKLRSTWGYPSCYDAAMLTFAEPLALIRRYFGEEIAFHFLFMQVLTRCLGILVLPALVCAWFLRRDETQNWARLIFTAILMIWYRWLKKHWERTEAEYSIAWGIDVHKYSGMKLLTNPRFHNNFLSVLVDASKELGVQSKRRRCTICACEECQCTTDFKRRNVPFAQKVQRFRGSVLSFLCTVLCIITLLLLVKVEINYFLSLYDNNKQYRRFVFGILGVVTSIQIFVFDGIWSFLATYITDLELNDDEYTYFRSKSLKLCIVRWINVSISMIYTAFVLPLFSPGLCPRSNDDQDDCASYFAEVLPSQFIMILVTRFLLLLFMNNVVKPHFMLPWKYPKGCGEVEKQAFMKKYSGTEIDEDFLNILIPVCFFVLFGIMMPSVVLLLFIVCVLQKRITAMKLVFYYQRPYPHLARSIHFHNLVLGFFGYLMIACNLALISIHFGDVSKMASTVVLHNMPISKVISSHWSFPGACVFLLAMLILVTLWRLVDVFVPAESSKLKSEIHLHALQIHKVFYRADVMKDVDITPSLNLRNMDLQNQEWKRMNFEKVRPWGEHSRTERTMGSQRSWISSEGSNIEAQRDDIGEFVKR